MSHHNIIKYLQSKNKRIDIQGVLKDTSWIPTTILVIITAIIVNIYYLYKYTGTYPITLYCDSLYSHFTEQLLILNKIKYYKIYKPFINNRSYYTTSRKKNININPNVRDWVNENIKVKTLSEQELILLSDHLSMPLDKVKQAQDKVLTLLPEINAYHIIRERYLEDELYNKEQYAIKNIIKDSNLYKIETNHHCFYTKLILSDEVILSIGDVINGFYYSNTDDNVYTEQKYIVNSQYQLESLNKKLKEDMVSLPFYNLEIPRAPTKLHPFHLPKSKDPILSILIMTQLLIKND